MANVQIKDITTTKTTFLGSEFMEGQESAGGTNSSFNFTFESLANYIHKFKVGFVDYNDLATATTAITHSGSGGYIKLTNDISGAYTNTSYFPTGITTLWNTTNNQLDFTELSLGDMVDIRVDIVVTTTANNQDVDLKFRLGIGGSAYDLVFHHVSPKAAGTYNIVRYMGLYMGDTNTLNNPAEIMIDTDASADIKVNGWYCKITRR